MRLLRAAAIAMALPALGPLAGCGGESDDRLTFKERYIREADATCARESRRIQDKIEPYLAREADRPQPRPEVARAMVREALAPAMSYEVRSVRAIVLPERDVPQVLEFLATWQEAVDWAAKHPVAYVRAAQPFARPERLARDYGFQVCGSL